MLANISSHSEFSPINANGRMRWAVLEWLYWSSWSSGIINSRFSAYWDSRNKARASAKYGPSIKLLFDISLTSHKDLCILRKSRQIYRVLTR